jgi:DNA-binding CsgD family transcriptional regulator
MELAERAKDLAEGMSLDTHLQIDAAWAAGSLLLGRKDGLDELLRILDTVNSNPSLLEQFSESGWWPLVWCGSSCTFTERFDDAQRAFELGFPTVEKRGWPAAMGAYLVSHMELLFRTGRIEETRASLGELENLVKLAPLLRPFAMLSLGVLELEGGKFEAVEEISAQLEGMLGIFPQPPPILALWTLYLRGNLEAKRGRYDAACETFREIRAIAELGEINEPCVVPWWVSAMGVYRTTSRFDEIEGLVEWLLGTTAELPCLFPRAGIESGRAFLAEARGEIGKARECFERAVDLMGAVPMPIETAKILLWQGRFLRRQNDLVAARRTLAKAYELAKSSSSQKIASKAATDLRLAGGRVRQAKRSAGQLTQRQGEVAELASNGRTNSEIANELGISPKTVERHLENVYDTLGVRSRRDLMRRRFNSGVQIL